MGGHKVDLRERTGKHNNLLDRKVIEETQWVGHYKVQEAMGKAGRRRRRGSGGRNSNQN